MDINIHLLPVCGEKNRFRNRDGSFGVDLNRNFVQAWGGPGSSRTPSSDIYCGEKPLSELETKALDDYLQRYNGSIEAGIDYHSFSQLILRP